MLKLKDISIFFSTFALRNINLEIESGDYFIILGNSGAGKTVLLETIAGLIKPHSGNIFLREKNITNEKIQDRKIGIVFQDYALFPHFSVFENIAFSLKQKKVDKNELRYIVFQLAKELEIVHLLKRKPTSLSGGEKQRVAIARTLAMKPDVLLLDEPLSALDTKLRSEARSLLRKLNQKGQTIIHVTHNFDEAMMLANKIAVINNGVIEQIGTPIEIFENPKSDFIAKLYGIKNYFLAEIISHNINSNTTNILIDGKIKIEKQLTNNIKTNKGAIIIDSHEIILTSQKQNNSKNQFYGTVVDIINYFNEIEVLVNIEIPIVVNISKKLTSTYIPKIGDKVFVNIPNSAIKYLEN